MENEAKELQGTDKNGVEDIDESRRAMIASAERFLLNPKVSQSPMTQKRQFLKSKGLTDAEIDTACVRAGVPLADPPPLPVSGSFSPTHPVFEAHRPTWGKTLRELLEIAALFGGVAYGLYRFWKSYISRWLFGKSQKTSEEVQREASEALQRTVASLVKSVDALQVSIEDQLSVLRSSLQERSSKDVRTDTFSDEVRSELRSIKGIMLSTSRFPISPVTKPAAIPSWQLEPKNGSAEPQTNGTADASLDSMESGGSTTPDVAM